MIAKLKNLIIATGLIAALIAPALEAAPAYARTCDIGDTGCQSSSSGTGSSGTGSSGTGPGTGTTATGAQLDIDKNLCGGSNLTLSAQDLSNCNDSSSPTGIGAKIKKLLNILSAIVGLVAVVMIIYAGFRYVTSAGSEAGVKTAKNAIIYAIIGLVVVALAQVIVHFVISNVT